MRCFGDCLSILKKAQQATKESSCLSLQVRLIHVLLEVVDLSCELCRVGYDIMWQRDPTCRNIPAMFMHVFFQVEQDLRDPIPFLVIVAFNSITCFIRNPVWKVSKRIGDSHAQSLSNSTSNYLLNSPSLFWSPVILVRKYHYKKTV